MRAADSSSLHTLTEINLLDLLDSIGLARLHGTPLARAFRPSARRFAGIASEFDRRVGAEGLAQGSAWLVERMSSGLIVTGQDRIPAQGPLMVLANHPGMTDTVALFRSLAVRTDLRVIAADRPFLRALPQVARHLIFLPDEERGRLAVLRGAARHLQQGGALLSFPAGEIEPDPDAFGAEAALESLRSWSASYSLFARLAPETQFLPVCVSNVISRQAQRHPLTRLRRTERDRERLATALQVSLPRYRDLVARVAFGRPQTVGSDGAQALGPTIEAQMRELILARASDAARAMPS